MTRPAAPDLPARDFEATAPCHARLGLEATRRDAGWRIRKRGGLVDGSTPRER